MLISKIQDTQRRLVVRHQIFWGNRISENAADKSLRLYEYMFAGYVQITLFLILSIALMKFGPSSLAYASIGIGVVSGVCFFLIALHYGKQAGVDIARSHGFPDRVWRRVMVKTPAQFDGWLAKEKAKNPGPGSR